MKIRSKKQITERTSISICTKSPLSCEMVGLCTRNQTQCGNPSPSAQEFAFSNSFTPPHVQWSLALPHTHPPLYLLFRSAPLPLSEVREQRNSG